MESGSVLVGDVADEIAADLVLISSEAVHTKQVRLRGRTLVRNRMPANGRRDVLFSAAELVLINSEAVHTKQVSIGGYGWSVDPVLLCRAQSFATYCRKFITCRIVLTQQA
jgi:hypothetical protein